MLLHWAFLMLWTLHGVGHIAGVLAAWTDLDQGFRLDREWVLPGAALITSPVGKLWSAFWLATVVLTVLSSYGLYTGAAWWRDIATFAAAASLVAVLPWARTVSTGALFGAAFSSAVLVTLLIPLDAVLALIEA